MRGVVLAGGTGSRLDPLTRVINKHLLPVYDKPMIFHSLEAMARAGIDQVMVVTGGHNCGDFGRLLGDGHLFGLRRLEYAYQEGPGGIAQALGLAEAFCSGESVCLMLGDNVLEYSFRAAADRFRTENRGGRVLLAAVENPEAYGVAELDGERVLRVVEKPRAPQGNCIVCGVYFFDNQVFDIIRGVSPSPRGELEITDVNNAYISRGAMRAERINGYWADCGESIDGYLRACNLVAERGANKPSL